MKKLIRFDWALKKLLRHKANFSILEGFLSELLRENIKIEKILESEANKETYATKFNRVDILCENSQKELMIIEIQNTHEFDYLQRIIFGTSKLITEYIKEGEPYSKIKKVYSINLIYFDFGQGQDYIYHGTTRFMGIHNHDELQLNENQKKLYQDKQVYQIFPEYYLIKINQFNDIAKDTLDEWIYFLKNEEIQQGFTAKGLKEAKKNLDVLKLNEKERQIYKGYLEHLHDEASYVETTYYGGLMDGEKMGLQRGREEGLEKGERIKVLEIAKNLLDILDDTTLAEKTGLSLDEIKKLRHDTQGCPI
jgi:predicted transposase/invertase (TIGR01784 family)